MKTQAFIVDCPLLGRALITIAYYQGIPVYQVTFLDNRKSIVLFLAPNGRWQEDGKGITDLSESLGELFHRYHLR